ncbi:MAG TPA: hypothetical protein VK835_03395 [Bacteroidia bacterium]|jgi:hypothetical protein|nr:hypothetical protein [Bacteroidia bacterium]
MKVFFISLFIFLQFVVFAQQPVKVFVSYTNSYCGGARPTDAILAKYNTPNKLTNFKIKIAGKKTSVVTTDTAGCFTHKLKPGKYFIFLTEEKNKNLFINYDPNCVKMLKAYYGELIIEKGKNDYKINLHFPCNLCQPNNRP